MATVKEQFDQLGHIGKAEYVEGLKRELKGAKDAGDKDHISAVTAELSRVGNPEKETADAPKLETA